MISIGEESVTVKSNNNDKEIRSKHDYKDLIFGNEKNEQNKNEFKKTSSFIIRGNYRK